MHLHGDTDLELCLILGHQMESHALHCWSLVSGSWGSIIWPVKFVSLRYSLSDIWLQLLKDRLPSRQLAPMDGWTPGVSTVPAENSSVLIPSFSSTIYPLSWNIDPSLEHITFQIPFYSIWSLPSFTNFTLFLCLAKDPELCGSVVTFQRSLH